AGGGDAALQPILDLVCARFCVQAAEVLGKSRRARIIWPRHATRYLLSRITSGSSTYIGQIMGGKDHATILNSLRAVEDRMQTEGDFAALINELLSEAQAV